MPCPILRDPALLYLAGIPKQPGVCVCVGGGGGGATQADYLQWGHLEPFLQSNGGRYTVICMC